MKYDYGAFLNMRHYGELTPPVYELTKIPNYFPLFLSYGAKDTLSDIVDDNILLNALSSHDSEKLKTQLIDEYAHVDFIMGVNANVVVYNPIMEFLRSNS